MRWVWIKKNGKTKKGIKKGFVRQTFLESQKKVPKSSLETGGGHWGEKANPGVRGCEGWYEGSVGAVGGRREMPNLGCHGEVTQKEIGVWEAREVGGGEKIAHTA